MITTFVLVMAIVAAFLAGWLLRGMLCLRPGGCDAFANDTIAALEEQLALERMARR